MGPGGLSIGERATREEMPHQDQSKEKEIFPFFFLFFFFFNLRNNFPFSLFSAEACLGSERLCCGVPHPSDTHPGLGGRWALSSQADTGRVWSPSGGWCCTGLPHGMAGSDTYLPGGTGGLEGPGGGKAV